MMVNKTEEWSFLTAGVNYFWKTLKTGAFPCPETFSFEVKLYFT